MLSRLTFLILLLSMTSCGKSWQVNSVQYQSIDFDPSSNEEDEALLELIRPYKAELDQKMHEILAINQVEIFKAKPAGALNCFIADAIFEYTTTVLGKEVDFAVSNYGGMRLPSLPKGDISLGRVYELMPFENMLLLLEMPGSVVETFFDMIADQKGWPVSKNIKFRIDSIKQEHKLTIEGEPLNPDRIYKVLVPDYIANGGDNCDYLIPCAREELGILIRDVLIEYLQGISEKGEELFIEVDGRITYD